jgi:hypothetical protein
MEDILAEVLEQAAADGIELHPAEVEADIMAAMAEAGPVAIVVEPEPEPVADGPAYDTLAARDEWRALKAWQQGGQQGDRPSTANLDAQNAAHAAGTPRPKTGRKAAERKPRNPRRVEANTTAKQGFEARKQAGVVKWTDEELAAWMRQAVADNPATTMADELEYAYWVERVAISRKRFYTVWAATFEA